MIDTARLAEHFSMDDLLASCVRSGSLINLTGGGSIIVKEDVGGANNRSKQSIELNCMRLVKATASGSKSLKILINW